MEEMEEKKGRRTGNQDPGGFPRDMDKAACIVGDTFRCLCCYEFFKPLLKAIVSLSAAGDEEGAEALAEGASALFLFNAYSEDARRIEEMLEGTAEGRQGTRGTDDKG